VPAFLPHIPGVRQDVANYYSSVYRADQCAGEVLAPLDASGQADDTLVIFLSDHTVVFSRFLEACAILMLVLHVSHFH